MSPWQTFWAGVAPDHAAALIVTALLPVIWWFGRPLTGHQPAAGPPLPLTQRWAIAGLAATGILHLALPIGHHDNALLTLGFVAAGAAYLWLATRVLRQRSWRLLTALLVTANLIGYLIVITAGGEEPDQVGILTALDELMLFALACNGPSTRRLRRAAASTATVGSVVLVGLVIWISSFAAHQASDLDATLTKGGGTSGEVVDAPHDDGHQHDHAARAQAGVIMRALADHHPTTEQIRAAEQLATKTQASIARFTDIHAAIAAGYQPSGATAGTEVHLENKSFDSKAYILDADHPQALVYVIADGKASLLGAVYRMPVAGRPGPEPGAAITRWHAHNICLTPLPPGAGLPSPFGGCSALSIGATMPEMMHVWTVGNPGGPYAESIDQKWAYDYNSKHGKPWQNGS
ncbi:hypothetical protein Rhe02_05880 [Rhizocola hellebori]|uniref:Uncharacterized protein n=1 Tax=Rhizocola hellebori TaxID=1392758 RepID=A0A8J3Q2M4_9ACTN|nr:hypothetical protein [Rhizocola hellebori]GIH02521.1 hypothetical protein Rhe02_05880 [Rhizocola hellebori]